MLVSDYMSASPVTIQQDADYNQAFEIMQTQDLHHLPVLDAGSQVVGIVTRRDLQLAARHYHEAPVEVSEVMHQPVETISASASLATAAKRMAAKRIGCLPVLDRRRQVIGMITETDLFRALSDALSGPRPAKARSSTKATTKKTAVKKAAVKKAVRKKAATKKKK